MLCGKLRHKQAVDCKQLAGLFHVDGWCTNKTAHWKHQRRNVYDNTVMKGKGGHWAGDGANQKHFTNTDETFILHH